MLVAREGEAPVALTWLDDVDMSATPPEYLHEAGGPFLAFSPTRVPRGTVVTVRGRPRRGGRHLVLTDGDADVSFIDDGSGAAIARWTVKDSDRPPGASPRGLAPSGSPRRISSGSASIPDEFPKVIVEGAPRTVKLIDEPNIPVLYETTDDHGLREVDLVLRTAGGKEERRVLSRPAADAKSDRGGYELRANDAFLKKAYAPVEVTVEARDNDAVSGPKWGKSDAIVIIPPQVGEAEALRYAALLGARAAIVDLLADRLEMKPVTPALAKGHVGDEAAAQEKAFAVADKALGGSWGGLVLKGRFVMVARGQLRRLAKALATEKAKPTPAAHDKLVEETESALLTFDAGLRVLGTRDAQSVAKRLADVAEDVANTISTSEEGDKGATKAHLDASVSVLGGGALQMVKIGDLGRDLGEIVQADLRRVDRSRVASNNLHTELAARDLAARLRKPVPSFMGGGGHGAGGVESGGGGGGGEGADGAADAASEGAAAMQDLEDITRDHQQEMDSLQQRLDSAASEAEKEAFKDEAKEHAQVLRDAAKGLPQPSADAAGAESAAGQGREESEAMAGALERGDAAGAADHGKRAVQALREAKRLGDQAGGFFPEQQAGQRAEGARGTVERELAWTEDALQKMRRAASASTKGDLAEHGKSEKKIADRAQALAKKGEGGESAMPQDTLDHVQDAERKMREAEKALQEGDGPNALNQQKEAQRLLEMAESDRSEDSDQQQSREGPRGGDGDHASDSKKPSKRPQWVPGANEHRDPVDFRKRVLEGLRDTSDPRLRAAMKRYAEGLVK